eukprot:365320-Chlamydomonas_euryale.AAC.3
MLQRGLPGSGGSPAVAGTLPVLPPVCSCDDEGREPAPPLPMRMLAGSPVCSCDDVGRDPGSLLPGSMLAAELPSRDRLEDVIELCIPFGRAGGGSRSDVPAALLLASPATGSAAPMRAEDDRLDVSGATCTDEETAVGDSGWGAQLGRSVGETGWRYRRQRLDGEDGWEKCMDMPLVCVV